MAMTKKRPPGSFTSSSSGASEILSNLQIAPEVEEENADLQEREYDGEEENEENFQPQKSEKIDVSSRPKEDETVMVDFISEEDSEGFFSKKPPKSEEPVKDDFADMGHEEIKQNISSFEEEKSKKMTFADFQQTAEFLLNFIDTVFSTAMRYWAKDTSASAYELPREKRRSLVNQLAMILAKHQTRFAIEAIFLATLVAAYSGPFMKAKSLRDMKKGKKPVSIPDEHVMAEVKGEKVIKRKSGGPSKH